MFSKTCNRSLSLQVQSDGGGGDTAYHLASHDLRSLTRRLFPPLSMHTMTVLSGVFSGFSPPDMNRRSFDAILSCTFFFTRKFVRLFGRFVCCSKTIAEFLAAQLEHMPLQSILYRRSSIHDCLCKNPFSSRDARSHSFRLDCFLACFRTISIGLFSSAITTVYSKRLTIWYFLFNRSSSSIYRVIMWNGFRISLFDETLQRLVLAVIAIVITA